MQELQKNSLIKIDFVLFSMKHYPYFVFEFLLFSFLLLLVPAISIFYGYTQVAILSILLFALIFVRNIGKVKDFEKSISKIKKITSWESDFFSLGRLIFDYEGEQLYYKSFLLGKVERSFSVDYELCARNDNKKKFEILNVGSGWLNEYSVSGDKQFLSSIKGEITKFNKEYMLVRLCNNHGILKMIVNIRFKDEKPPSKEIKLDSMNDFLDDYLEFASKINKKLKAKKN